MSKKLIKIAAITSILGVTILGITACSGNTPSDKESGTPKTSETRIPVPSDVNDISTDISTQKDNSYIVGPVTASTENLLKIKYVKVPAGSELQVTNIDSSENSLWTATSSDERIVVFVQGTNSSTDNLAGTQPIFKVINIGKSDIVMSNSTTGETVKFVLEGIPVR